MKNLALLGLLPLFLISALASSAEAVPVTTSFTARIVDGSGPVSGNVAMTFKIYDAPTSGTLQWEETHASVAADAGLVFVELGAIDPTNNGLDEAVFTGEAMFMEVTVSGDVQSPRVPILAVPYAIRAALAENVVNENDPIYGASPAAGITGAMITGWNTDNTLNESQVDAFVANNGYSTGAHLTEAQVDTFVANNGYSTGNHTTNTNLTEAQVDAFVADNGYSLTTHDHAGVYAPVSHTHRAADIIDEPGFEYQYVNSGAIGSAASPNNATITLATATLTIPASGYVVVNFDGYIECVTARGRILIAVNSSQSWGANDGNVAQQCITNDYHSVSHSRVYSVSAGTRSFYAVSDQFNGANGGYYVYGTLTATYFPTRY